VTQIPIVSWSHNIFSHEIRENGTLSDSSWSARVISRRVGEGPFKNVPVVRFGEWIPDRRDSNYNPVTDITLDIRDELKSDLLSTSTCAARLEFIVNCIARTRANIDICQCIFRSDLRYCNRF